VTDVTDKPPFPINGLACARISANRKVPSIRHIRHREGRIGHRGHLPSQSPDRSRISTDSSVLVRYIPRHPSKALGISSSYKVELTGNHGKVTTEGGVFTPNVTFYTHTIPINREAHSG